jgi:hypothetical protein
VIIERGKFLDQATEIAHFTNEQWRLALAQQAEEVKLFKKSLPGPLFSPRLGYALRMMALGDVGGPMCEARSALAGLAEPGTISPFQR